MLRLAEPYREAAVATLGFYLLVILFTAVFGCVSGVTVLRLADAAELRFRFHREVFIAILTMLGFPPHVDIDRTIREEFVQPFGVLGRKYGEDTA